MRRQSVEVVEIPTDRIEPDPANPNQMTESVLEALRQDIESKGFVQPVLVRPTEDHGYVIVDGEHRWRVLRDAGIETVPCVVDDRTEDDARLRMVSMNRLRGSFEPSKLAGVVSGLADEMGEEALTEILGMEGEEFTTVLAGESLDEEVADAVTEATVEAQPEVFSWKFTRSGAESVEAAIEARMVAGALTRADALIEILSQSLPAKPATGE